MHVFFADFSKGFDLVDHNMLIEELKLSEDNEYLIRWITTFLTSRPSHVKINCILSTTVLPNGRIPQGTKLSPLLFAILVNPLVWAWPYCVTYVDDTTVYEVIPRCFVSYLPCVTNDIYYLLLPGGCA